MTYPGQQVNYVVRVLGTVTILVAGFIALWIAATASDMGPGAATGGVVIPVAVFLNGLLGGALLVVFGAIGDNLIAIRRESERANAITRRIAGEIQDDDRAVTKPVVDPDHSDYQGPRCPKCDFPVKPDDDFCTNCGTEL